MVRALPYGRTSRALTLRSTRLSDTRIDAAGAELVRDVAPYEAMKLRCASCTHQAICYFGTLLGYRYGHEALEDPRILELVHRYLSEEALPSLTPNQGCRLHRLRSPSRRAFRQPEIADTLARIRAFGSDRIPKWLLPVVRDNLAAGRSWSSRTNNGSPV
jgi:mannitol 2-dehydrogenase